MRERITTLSKRMDKLDRYKNSKYNMLTYKEWNRYFKLHHLCSSEYAFLIRENNRLIDLNKRSQTPNTTP